MWVYLRRSHAQRDRMSIRWQKMVSMLPVSPMSSVWCYLFILFIIYLFMYIYLFILVIYILFSLVYDEDVIWLKVA